MSSKTMLHERLSTLFSVILPIVLQIESIFQQNTSLCEASTKIGTDVHYDLLLEKSPLATSIFKMAATFQDGRQLH